MEIKKIFDGIFLIDGQLATENLVPGEKVYGERLVKIFGKEYRLWDAYRSKLAGAIKKGIKEVWVKRGWRVLYLGASTGTTVSHFSDILGKDGVVYAVEISPHSMKNLLRLCEKRENIVPILADANKPEAYKEIRKVDMIYQDVAQPNQDEIVVKNARMFLERGGIVMLAIKSQSIDAIKKPNEVFEKVLEKLKTDFEIVEKTKLEPFDSDHLFVVLRRL